MTCAPITTTCRILSKFLTFLRGEDVLKSQIYSLNIEIKQECEAVEVNHDRKLKITRRKYVFADSKGGQVEVVSEESEPKGKLKHIQEWLETKPFIPDITRENLESEDQPKVSKKAKHLLMSLISGGADYTIKPQDDQ
jgi:hypothetical protein